MGHHLFLHVKLWWTPKSRALVWIAETSWSLKFPLSIYAFFAVILSKILIITCLILQILIFFMFLKLWNSIFEVQEHFRLFISILIDKYNVATSLHLHPHLYYNQAKQMKCTSEKIAIRPSNEKEAGEILNYFPWILLKEHNFTWFGTKSPYLAIPRTLYSLANKSQWILLKNHRLHNWKGDPKLHFKTSKVVVEPGILIKKIRKI